MIAFKTGWYLIYTKHHQERKVTAQLSEKNIKAYLPVTRLKRKWSDRIKIICAPFFPSYVFVYLNSLHEYYAGINVTGSCYYVKFGNQPARLSEHDIDHIRMMESSGENIEIIDQHFNIGQQLIIQQGPLSGLQCEVVQYRGKKRILVRVHILQRCIMADLPYTFFGSNN